MPVYYNEIDPFAAAWLRNLIAAGRIAPGEVDERSILKVQPDDLCGFAQCHFFAGIGVWSYALRRAGWADDRPVWTGSCPCQPFSAAGKGDEFADERHLWPAWFRLIRECRPVAVIGEQVASKDALAWLDHVSADLEGEGYAVGAVDTCAAGFGAPHIRQRLYFVADAILGRQPTRCGDGRCKAGEGSEYGDHAERRGIVGDAESGGFRERGYAAYPQSSGHPDGAEQLGLLGDPIQPGSQGCERPGDLELHRGTQPDGSTAAASVPRATNGFWADAEWIPCRDGKARPVEPGTSPLAHGAPAGMGLVCAACLQAHEKNEDYEGLRELWEILGSPSWSVAAKVLQSELYGRCLDEGIDYEGARQDSCAICGAETDWLAEARFGGDRVGRLRGYGNAICAPQAEEFVRTFMEIAR